MEHRIDHLTADQTTRLIEFREEWRTIGLTSGPVNRMVVKSVFDEMYSAIRRKPVPLVVLSSPASALLALQKLNLLLADQLGGQLGDQLWDQLGDQLWDQLGDQLADQLGGQLGVQLRDQLKDQLWDQLWDQLGGQLRDQLGDQLGGQLGDQLRDQLGDQLSYQAYYGLGGHCEAYWIAFYRFPEQIGCTYAKTEQHRLAWWDILTRHCGWWWPCENVVIASDRPTTRWNAAYQLHAEDRPAIEFPDGYSLWALNGVRVPKQLVLTASHDLDPQKWVLKQSNAAIRREAVRKIGIERVCAQLQAQMLDRTENYELITLNLGDTRKRPYLKMVNPSTGTYHVEGVPSNITTVQEALTWRNGTDQTPEILT